MPGASDTTSARRLIINSDDFGFSAGVNRGIVEAHRAGVVTSTSLMVNEPGWSDAVRLARETPTLDIGVHVNLVHGAPLADVPTLTDRRTGRFHPLRQLALRAATGRVAAADIRAEALAQIARVREAGIVITHLDSHRHAHVLPGVWSAVTDAAISAGINVIRRPREPFRRNSSDLAASLSKLGLAAAQRMGPRTAARSPDHFLGISLQGGPRFEPRLLAILDSLPPGTTELMVHVGHSDATLVALDPYTTARDWELRAILSPRVRSRLREGDIELIHFGQL